MYSMLILLRVSAAYNFGTGLVNIEGPNDLEQGQISVRVQEWETNSVKFDESLFGKFIPSCGARPRNCAQGQGFGR